MLISRIAAVQEKIETIESSDEAKEHTLRAWLLDRAGTEEEAVADAEKAEKEEEEEEALEALKAAEEADAEALKAAEALAEEAEKVAEAVEEVAVSAPESFTEPEAEAYKELKILEGLADAHEDVTKKEIAALEALAAGRKPRSLFNLREAGAMLREKVDKEFRAMREREAALLGNIQETKAKIEEVEKGPPADSKAVLELRMLESLASSYEDTTAEEIKALQKLAKEGGM